MDVKNAHIINVNADLFPENEYSEYVKVDTNIEVILESDSGGLVSVNTIDVINVQAQIGGGFILKTLKDIFEIE